jgi:hypothetical protein
VEDRQRADEAWGAQIGPALNEPDVARLLDTTKAAVRGDPSLLRLTNRDGTIVYPVCQFDAGRPLTGVGEAVLMLSDVWQSLTVAAWLTAPNRRLDGRTPVQALRDGDVAAVHALALRARANAEAHGI